MKNRQIRFILNRELLGNIREILCLNDFKDEKRRGVLISSRANHFAYPVVNQPGQTSWRLLISLS